MERNLPAPGDRERLTKVRGSKAEHRVRCSRDPAEVIRTQKVWILPVFLAGWMGAIPYFKQSSLARYLEHSDRGNQKREQSWGSEAT